ncbi:LPP20 family lipoprotein [Myxococcota bacterium]|nr:LPP20 family lipoprotein [Myxococcota bacterium]
MKLKALIYGIAIAVLTSSPAYAADVAHGQVKWTKKVITATGSAAPSLKAPNAAAARLGAERAAKMDALRNILETVKGLKVTSSSTAGDLMATDAKMKTSVQGVVRQFKVIDTKYYSDGGVDVIVEVALDGVLTEALLPGGGGKAKAGAAGAHSGIIINAKGVDVSAALAPRLIDEQGNEIYSASMILRDVLYAQGVVGYSKSLDAATKDARVADKPLVIRALKTTEPGGADLIISNADARKMEVLAGELAQGKVIIVTD